MRQVCSQTGLVCYQNILYKLFLNNRYHNIAAYIGTKKIPKQVQHLVMQEQKEAASTQLIHLDQCVMWQRNSILKVMF